MCFKRKKKQNKGSEFFETFDDETKQETCIKYLRKLDAASLKKLYAAVDLYRDGDKILTKVKEPEPEIPEQTNAEEENPDELKLKEG